MITRRKFVRASILGSGAFIMPSISTFTEATELPIMAYHAPNTSPIHMPGGIGVEHSFQEQQFDQYGDMEGCRIIFQHGFVRNHPELKMKYRSIENVAVFSSKKKRVPEISKKDLLSVLAGDIVDWKDLGGIPGRIQIYFNYENVKVDGFFRFLKNHGVYNGFLNQKNRIHRANGYKELSRLSSQDSNALVFGLRKHFLAEQTLMAIDGIFPHLQSSLDIYPLQMQAIISVRRSIQDNEIKQLHHFTTKIESEYKSDEQQMDRLLV